MAGPVSLGDLYLASDSYTDALACYLEALDRLGSELDRGVRGRLYMKIARCYRELGRTDQALAFCRKTLGLDLSAEGPRIQGDAEVVLAAVEIQNGRFDAALASAQSAYDLLRYQPETKLLAEASQILGIAHAELGNLQAARDYLTDCLVTLQRLGEEADLAYVYANLGVLAKRTGDLNVALRHLEKALEIDRRLGRASMVAGRLRNIGNVLFRLSRWEEAEKRLNEARDICVRIGAARRLVAVQGALGNLARGRGEWSRAEELFQEVLTKSREAGYRRAEALALEFRGELESDRGQHRLALATLDEALEAAKRLSPKSDVIGEVLRRRAEVLLDLGRVDDAERDCSDALARFRASGDKLEEGAALRAAARVCFARGEITEAHRLISQAEAILRSVCESFELAKCALVDGIGLTASASEDELPIDRIDARLLTASALFAEIGATCWAGRCELARAKAFLKAGQLDRSRACAESARKRFRAIDDARSLSEVEALLRELDTRLAAGATIQCGRRYALIARGHEPAQATETGLADLHERAAAIADVVSAQRLLLVSRSDGGDFRLATSVDRAGHGGVNALRFVRAVALARGCDKPIVMTGNSGRTRLPAGAGAAALIPAAAEDAADCCYLLYVDRARADGSAAFAQRDVEFLGEAARVLATIHSGVREGQLCRDRRDSAEGIGRDPGHPDMVARNRQMLRILDQVEHLRESLVPVLIGGESGTGKEVIARAIHRGGRSSTGDFVALNAGAIAPHLQESELFGHAKGAFTDAHRDREGLVAAASGGTLFLDEIGEMSRTLQVKLLRFLQDGEYRRVGENRSRRSDARVISATNKDLTEEVKAGRFRKDLLYRLCTFVIDVPPLRDRPEDVEPLMKHFFELHCSREGKRIAGFSREVRDLFLRYDWRENNVRELENEIRRAVALSDEGDEIEMDKISPELRARCSDGRPSGRRSVLKEELETLEKNLILDALDTCAWNKKRASEILGISRTGLLTKMKKYAIG